MSRQSRHAASTAGGCTKAAVCSTTTAAALWQQCSGLCISAHAPDLLPAAVHHPVVPVKGQAVAQQVEQAGLGRELLRPPPAAGRQVTWLVRCVHVRAPTETAATPGSAPCTIAAAAVGHAHQQDTCRQTIGPGPCVCAPELDEPRPAALARHALHLLPPLDLPPRPLVDCGRGAGHGVCGLGQWVQAWPCWACCRHCPISLCLLLHS